MYILASDTEAGDDDATDDDADENILSGWLGWLARTPCRQAMGTRHHSSLRVPRVANGNGCGAWPGRHPFTLTAPPRNTL